MIPVLTALGTAASVANAIGNATQPKQSKELTQQDFLNLLTKQLTSQDPLKPFDSSSMLQQMANLTSLNSSETLKKSIEALQGSIGNNQLFQASQVVGHQVAVNSPTATLGTDGLKGAISLSQAASNVAVAIKDSSGKTLKTLNLGNAKSGTLDFSWDGIADDGSKAAPGTYQISATGMINGQNTALTTAGMFKVNSVALNTQGAVQLNVDQKGVINLSDILKIL